MKKIFQKSVLGFLFIAIGLSFSATNVFAGLDWGVGVDSNGGFSAAVGSEGAFSGSDSGGYGGGYGSGGGWAISNPYGLPEGSVMGIASNLLFWLLSLFAILGIIGFVISGIWYLVSAGDEGMAEKGKEGMKYSIIGIIIGLSGFIIMQAVNAMLGAASTNF